MGSLFPVRLCAQQYDTMWKQVEDLQKKDLVESVIGAVDGIYRKAEAEKIARRYYEIPKERRNGKCQITVSTSFFVPKPFTPFQWARMCTREEFLEKAHTVNAEIKEQLNRKSIRYNWHEADVTVLEGIFARGDRRVAKALRLAYEKGCLFDSWTEHFHNELWLAAFEEAGVDTDFYTTRKRELDEVFPWDFIDIGVTRKFLQRECRQILVSRKAALRRAMSFPLRPAMTAISLFGLQLCWRRVLL